MEYFQIILSAVFSILGAMSILFIASKAYSIGNDVSEIRDLLRELRRDAQHRADLGLGMPTSPAPGVGTGLGNWPSVADPEYDNGQNSELPYALRPEGDSTARRPKGW